MIQYKFKKPNENTVTQLIELSQKWVEEDCSYGIVADESDDWGDLLLVALDDEQIVGYIFGNYYRKEKKTSYMEAGAQCFEVEGLYVLPQYRSLGIGKELYRLLEKSIQANCSYITLSTSTKDYKRILKFYVDELGLTFHSAFLFKSLEEPLCE